MVLRDPRLSPPPLAERRPLLLLPDRTLAVGVPMTETEPDVCECGVPLDVHPPLPMPKPWDHGRPCGRKAVGQFASGSSFLKRAVRPPRNPTSRSQEELDD